MDNFTKLVNKMLQEVNIGNQQISGIDVAKQMASAHDMKRGIGKALDKKGKEAKKVVKDYEDTSLQAAKKDLQNLKKNLSQ